LNRQIDNQSFRPAVSPQATDEIARCRKHLATKPNHVQPTLATEPVIFNSIEMYRVEIHFLSSRLSKPIFKFPAAFHLCALGKDHPNASGLKEDGTVKVSKLENNGP
jgi:hypothetical protein